MSRVKKIREAIIDGEEQESRETHGSVKSKRKRIGFMAGQFTVPDDFNSMDKDGGAWPTRQPKISTK